MIKSSGLKAAALKGHTTSVFFDMLLSFCTLARNLNLSKTTEELKISRQTIRRHINDLEELRGTRLFDFDDRKYTITEEGQKALSEAEILLERADNWMSGASGVANGLQHIAITMEDDTPFYAQRHPISEMWNSAPNLIKKGFEDWSKSMFDIESEAMEQIKPYLIVYRKIRTDWICTYVGEESSYASWRGWTWAKSAVGSIFEKDPIGMEADSFILEAYEDVLRTGSVWYDHISTKFARDGSSVPEVANYQRLVMCGRLPNGELNVASLVARTNNLKIEGCPPEIIGAMPEEDSMDGLFG